MLSVVDNLSIVYADVVPLARFTTTTTYAGYISGKWDGCKRTRFLTYAKELAELISASGSTDSDVKLECS
jgi:hypothetical protein